MPNQAIAERGAKMYRLACPHQVTEATVSRREERLARLGLSEACQQRQLAGSANTDGQPAQLTEYKYNYCTVLLYCTVVRYKQQHNNRRSILGTRWLLYGR